MLFFGRTSSGTGAQFVAPNMAVFDYMPQRHVAAFKRAAGHFVVWILVRRGNPASKKFIGQPGYIPKMLDCKAKTAEIIQSTTMHLFPYLRIL